MSEQVTERALRRMIREALDNKTPGIAAPEPKGPVQVSSVVDPQASETDPSDTKQRPGNTKELGAALRAATASVPDDQAGEVFDQIQKAIGTTRDDNAEPPSNGRAGQHAGSDREDDKKMSESTKKIEEAIRAQVRRTLVEAKSMTYEFPDAASAKEALADVRSTGRTLGLEITQAGVSGNKLRVIGADAGHTEIVATVQDHGGAAGAATRKNATMTDVSGADFDAIAKEMGMAVSGAKQAVDKAMRKLRFVQRGMDPAELEILVLTAMKKYIDKLEATGELTGEEVKLLSDHPDIVRTLDGFREFLHNDIKRAAHDKGANISTGAGVPEGID